MRTIVRSFLVGCLLSCFVFSGPAARGFAAEGGKKIVFIAGNRSHGYGAHEHYAGCVLLAKALQTNMPGYKCVVVQNGYPKDESVFDDADAVVCYADGGGGHPLNRHLDKINELSAAGVGIGLIHYAVETVKGKEGDAFIDWVGGYFEPHWSVNPHWTAKFDEFPDHPVTRGVEPFEINDEWYYHMRFREDMKGVTPILTDLPGEETLRRPDGAHSGNPDVRAAVLQRKEPQHVMWVSEVGDRRGFGFTGGHNHWNWGDPNFRKIVLNAVVWIAHGEVPPDGVSDQPVTVDQLLENQDFEPPQNFDRKGVIERYNLQSSGDESASNSEVERPVNKNARASARPVFKSNLVTPSTPGHSVEIEADITGAKELFLVVDDGGNGFACDWADWAEPRLIGPAGEKRLTDLKWKRATTGWGNMNVNKNCEGHPLRIAGQSVEYGIGTHANSVIAYDLPSGFTKFRARGGLDNGGTDQGGCGAGSSVRFEVYTQQPPIFVARSSSGGSPRSDDAADAVDQLDVHDDLQASLFAAEPIMYNPTNIDIDHLGRVWVCEVINYRKFRNQDVIKDREAGDAIIILEDTDHDGAADKKTVFHQGHDVDSAHGICVLPTPSGKGTRALISVQDRVFFLIDDNGDLRADRKELLFTGIDGTEHDHGIHAFVFGPDGKLYFNFGNAGRRIKDKHGKPIVDMAGNEVNDSRRPYQEGMVFRCNMDGSQFETLGWNFRNNWEVCIDSFGTLWQSDNDDDGNRGTRINYVMEFGNYGYKDELTGAGWKTPRTNMEAEIPLQHWHLNDPGVVPNLLQTGAGSPTGICVYEGELLPGVFRDEVIHCDAGPSIVRAYPVEVDGAGYSADIVNMLDGSRINNWFRPSDVCVAPDGSLLVADWYDPGVGGHRMQDVEHGRLFRVTPAGYDDSYNSPPQDFSSLEGCVKALASPNLATRYMAWTKLHEAGVAAEPALQKLLSHDDARARARGIWLLGKIEGRGEHYVQTAIGDDNPNIRIVGVRLARQLDDVDTLGIVERLVNDPSAQVRRELAIALHYHQSPQAAELWAALAVQHDGSDRWYLEALGIGAAGHWDTCLAAWLKKVGDDWHSPAGRDIIWRSRADVTPQYLTEIILDPSTPPETHPRYFRAFDFQRGPEKDHSLRELLAGLTSGSSSPARDLATVETLLRLPGFDVNSNPAVKSAVLRHLETVKGQSGYLELVEKLRLRETADELLRLAIERPESTEGVKAASLLFQFGEADRLIATLDSDDEQRATAAATVLGELGNKRSVDILQPLLNDRSRSNALRHAAAMALGKNVIGQRALLDMVSSGALPQELEFAAANSLFTSPDAKIRNEARKYLSLPAVAGSASLPPLSELVKRSGNPASGKQIFATKGTCNKCHKVDGEGKEVGPDLSEIGSKLSKEAMHVSILNPSAGVSHNYETYAVILDSGNIETGIMVSETDDTVTLRTAEAIDKTIAKDEIDEMVKQPISLMPADLQKNLTVQELVDLVEYMLTLKKR